MERRSIPRKIKPRKRQASTFESTQGKALAEPPPARGMTGLNLDKKPAEEVRSQSEGLLLWPPPVEAVEEEGVTEDSDEPFPGRD